MVLQWINDMSYQDIQFDLSGGIARLTLNRPDKLNSFTANMHGEVADAMTRVENEGARVLVLTGAGRGFCAGQDLSERRPAADGTPPDLGETVDKYYGPLVRRINALPMPVVVGVNGVAAGAGANLAFAGDIVIAKESASFIQSFCKLGLIPDTGGTFVLPRLVGRARGRPGVAERQAQREASAGLGPDLAMRGRCRVRRHAGAAGAAFRQGADQGLAFTKRALQASLANDHERRSWTWSAT